MSQDFKLKFDQYKENAPTDKERERNPDYYPSGGNARNLAFVWPDGRRQFFNYNYLITCTFDNESGIILMEFSTHNVELKGRGLAQLFEELMTQVNKVISCSDLRYRDLKEHSEWIVNEFNIIKN